MKETQLVMESVFIANALITRQLISLLSTNGLITPEQVQQVLLKAKQDLNKSTLPTPAHDLDEVLRLFWPAFTDRGTTNH